LNNLKKAYPIKVNPAIARTGFMELEEIYNRVLEKADQEEINSIYQIGDIIKTDIFPLMRKVPSSELEPRVDKMFQGIRQQFEDMYQSNEITDTECFLLFAYFIQNKTIFQEFLIEVLDLLPDETSFFGMMATMTTMINTGTKKHLQLVENTVLSFSNKYF
jgi:phosphatidate phosphatase APP1